MEPTPETLRNPLLRYLLATRPAFLTVTLAGCVLGIASAASSGLAIQTTTALLTCLFALAAHAGANVVNDYYDALSGCDAGNTERQYPFTGGSRFIQNGVLSLRETALLGYGLLAAVVPAGLWLTAVSAPGLLWIGMAGLWAGWAYSSPPFRLQSRGLGEGGIVLAWLLIVTGSDFVQRQTFSFVPVASGLGFALLVANILFINQFPDLKADKVAGKRTLVVRLGPRVARWGYPLVALLAYGWLSAMILNGDLPRLAGLALLPAVISLKACAQLWQFAEHPARLAPALRMTIAAAISHGVLLALSLGPGR